ncbi:MAG TPA: lysylphosphatidylglycerol synthase domain-containing protein [Flavipsychrobacter sp.]|nr:lysylphosphatidylglycerol synthase domain-containing protein [Flavipsychrobacter sp.]
MNKNRKIWLNSLVGIGISAILLYSLWLQIEKQLLHFDGNSWWQEGNRRFLLIGILIMPLNLSLEVLKWKLLAGSAQPLSILQAWKSYFAGIAISLITPNRIGEYPGRILYLRRKNTIRLISVSILGAFAQFFALFFYGTVGLIYYNIAFPGYWQKLLLVVCCFVIIIVAAFYFYFEKWIIYFERIKWLRRLGTYKELIRRFTTREQVQVLVISVLRFAVYTVQYLVLLHWMNISFPLLSGFLMACLYFWSLAVIPSIAFAELGVRGQVSLFLFHHFSENTIGILAATVGLWSINLILPALIGSILLLRVRFFNS